ncbi:MAG: hypothetical protein SV108_09730 [Pseudomonadota bacterium]|nr:hypothetical protein [Pseudomonadota bacterium]
MNRRLLILITLAIAAILLWAFAFTGYFGEVVPDAQAPAPAGMESPPDSVD